MRGKRQRKREERKRRIRWERSCTESRVNEVGRNRVNEIAFSERNTFGDEGVLCVFTKSSAIDGGSEFRIPGTRGQHR